MGNGGGGKKRGYFGKRTLSNIAVICVGVLLFLALSNLSAVLGFIGYVWSIFAPFAVGVVIAYLLNMPMRFFERTLLKNMRKKRVLAVIITYVLALLLVGVLLGLIIPQLVDSISSLITNIPLYLDNFNEAVEGLAGRFNLDLESVDFFLVSYNDLITNVMDYILALFKSTESLSEIWGLAGRIGSAFANFLIGLISSLYMLISRDKLILQCRRLLYSVFSKPRADSVMHVGRLSNRIFSGFISGKILDSAIIGAICFVFMTVMNILSSVLGIEGIAMPFSVLISVVIGVTNVIPFFGPFIGAIPSIMILLMVNPWSAIWFTIFIIVLQQFDGNLIGPRILGDSTGLPAMWVLIAIIVFGNLMGFTGMLLGVPITAVLYSLGSDFMERRLRRKGLANAEGLARARGEGGGGVPYAKDDEPLDEGLPKADAEQTTVEEDEGVE